MTPSPSTAPAATLELHLPDMSCGHCVRTITTTVQRLDPQARLTPDLATRHVQIQTTADPAAIRAALSEEGYPPQGA
jgi:copper chaperone